MSRKKKLFTLLPATLGFVLLASACHNHLRKSSPVVQRDLPPVILWAWERPEDLEFLDSDRYGVAFLAQTLVLKGDEVGLNPRHQPLKVSPATRLIAVTRVESKKNTGEKAGLTSSQRERLVTLILRTAELRNVSAIQIDFDAAVSERQFYRELLQDLRYKLPGNIGLSMTALASFCIGDRWLDDLPVDEAIPMIFRMGADDRKIKSLLASGQDFREPLCQTSYGIAIDEPLEMKFAAARRLYVFGDHAWTENDVALLEEAAQLKLFRRLLALLLSLLFILECSTATMGCGPSYIEPIFVFKGSPDLPFNEFVNGKIGIVKPSFGRKTLVIAHRYLNGGSFVSEDQEALVSALEGREPEDRGSDAAKTWVAARKAFLKERDQLLEIYTERQYRGYDFFPNCAKNAFEVATDTLKDRMGSYGADDPNVLAWLAAQDTVFQNCGGGGSIPMELGAESPAWLRKDREYQVGAALFYALRFDEARARFEKIAGDNESPWQDTAAYLVARTLVREASFANDETRQLQLYEQAEVQLQRLLVNGGKFSNASLKLLGLVKYRVHPDARVVELGRTLDVQNGNENLRQDLIDYVWLLDKFEAQISKEEAKRKEAQKPAPDSDPFMKQASDLFSKQAKERNDAVQRGELISITLDQKKSDGTQDYSKWVHFDFKFDTSEDEVLQAFEEVIGKKLAPEEIVQVRDRRNDALLHRKWLLSPNQNWSSTDYEGGYDSEKPSPELIPSFLRADDLTDWVFTFESLDPSTYAHAFSKWRSTDSPAWLVAALTKAQASSRGLQPLLRAAEKVSRDAPAFPSVAYHLVRLRLALGRKAEARQLLDDIISWQAGVLPVSAQNQFLEQRLPLAINVSEFLRFAQRRPVTFYEEGQFGTLNEFFERQKDAWSDDWKESKEEFEKSTAEFFQDLLPWNDRFTFDEKTVDILNWQFPLQSLQAVSRDPALPDYLRRRLALVVWTRAILLKNEEVARSMAPDVVKLAPEMSSAFSPYLNARSDAERQSAALYILLKQPNMSPLMRSGLPANDGFERLDYYFEDSWWCAPSDTEYNDEGNEVPKVVARPGFLTPAQLVAAAKEHVALIAIGDGKSYLGQRVIEWAKLSPQDDRVPEALLIAAMANRQYKYGCNSWEFDAETKQTAETMLRQNYPQSEWIAKLEAP